MARVPYEKVAVEANRIIVRMATATTWEQVHEYRDLYKSYLEVCGWTDEEFDKETMSRISAAWIKYTQQNSN